ncbi:hypothetical protein [Nocardioides sp. Leaf374]|uniref:hypothetical protein n=1 Tax=Nocardioides sp. Leaf374 TaxID=2876560 RepID=UPI001E2E394E|nr:hypothetical protein [Nocardioides sp. Leaf374]
MTEPLVILVGPGFALDGDFKLRVTTEHAEEVAEALREAGFNPDPAAEFSATSDLAIFLVAFAQAGGLDGLASVLSAIFARHDGKRFVVRGPGNIEIEAEGYSAREVRSLLGSAAEWVEQQDATWRRAIEAGDVDPAVIESGEQGQRSATDVGDKT